MLNYLTMMLSMFPLPAGDGGDVTVIDKPVSGRVIERSAEHPWILLGNHPKIIVCLSSRYTHICNGIILFDIIHCSRPESPSF